MTLVMSFTFIPNQLKAAPASAVTSSTGTDAAKADALNARLYEIKNMDISNLTSPQKKELRKEVRTIKQQLSAIGGGVYISVGAVILILILLIILL